MKTKSKLRDMGKHKHDWKLMWKSDLSTRHKDAPPLRSTIIDIALDPGDRHERWRCVDCGEEKSFHNYPPLLRK